MGPKKSAGDDDTNRDLRLQRLGEQIAWLRDAAGWTQVELAERITTLVQSREGQHHKVGGAAVGTWERAKHSPGRRWLRALEEVFGLSDGALFDVLVEDQPRLPSVFITPDRVNRAVRRAAESRGEFSTADADEMPGVVAELWQSLDDERRRVWLRIGEVLRETFG